MRIIQPSEDQTVMSNLPATDATGHDDRVGYYDPAEVCQRCRRRITDRLERNVHVTLCAAPPLPFRACRGGTHTLCRRRIFVGQRCPDDGWLATPASPLEPTPTAEGVTS